MTNELSIKFQEVFDCIARIVLIIILIIIFLECFSFRYTMYIKPQMQIMK